jgi:hypothetical protein
MRVAIVFLESASYPSRNPKTGEQQPGYAAGRISSKQNGKDSKFEALQAPATNSGQEHDKLRKGR